MGLPQELDAVRIEFARKLPYRAELCDAKVEELRSTFPVAVIFYRGGWCSICNLHLRAYWRALDTIGMPSGRLLAISPQMSDAALSTTEANGIGFDVLSDAGNVVPRPFGIACVVAPEAQAAG